MDYDDIQNKPTINGYELTSEMDLDDIGIIEVTPNDISTIFAETFGFII